MDRQTAERVRAAVRRLAETQQGSVRRLEEVEARAAAAERFLATRDGGSYHASAVMAHR